MSAETFLIVRIILAASLYLFLGWAFYTLWKDLRKQSETAVSRLPAPLVLSMNGDSSPAQFTKPVVSIGRDPVSDLRLDDLTVSTQHARLVFHHNQWWIEDLGSTNGTYLNEDKILEPLVITTGDKVRVGQVVIDVNIGEK